MGNRENETIDTNMKNARANNEKNVFFSRSFGLLKQLSVCYFCVRVNIFFVCIIYSFETIQYISSKASSFVRINKRTNIISNECEKREELREQ